MQNIHVVRKVISFLGVVLVLTFLVGFFCQILLLNKTEYTRYELIYGWTVQVNDQVYENVNLDEFTFPDILEPGDVVTITNTLPKDIPTNSTVRISNYLTGVEVLVGGQSLYIYGLDLIQKHQFVGSGYHFISLHQNSGGQEIKIVFYPNEEAAFTSIPTIVLTDSNYIYADYFNSNLVAIFCSSFLFILGAVLTIVGFIAQGKDYMFHRLVPIGVFSYLIGLWSMCNTKFMELYSLNMEFNTTLEYMALYFAMIPMMALIMQVRRNSMEKEKWKFHILEALTGGMVVFAVLTTILHFLNVVRYPVVIPIFHGLAVLCVIMVVLLGAKPVKQMESDEKILNIALIEILFFGLVDMVRFNIQKYLFPDIDMMAVSILPLGTLIFIVLLLVSYLVYIYSMVMDKATRETLTKMAFQDSMTGLYNRAKAEELFHQFNEDKMAQCTMILFDLNRLKHTNDTLGHNQGDDLIRTFADTLRDTFSEDAYVIRMGGDEFLVFWMCKCQCKRLDDRMKHLIALDRDASRIFPFMVEASYGVAFSHEVELHDAESVYKLADQRMYQMKEELHCKRE